MLQNFLSLFSKKKAVPDQTSTRPAEFLLNLFAGHDIECTTYDGWVVPDGEFPAIQAKWFPRESSGVLEIRIFVREDVIIEECFAGIGSGDVGLQDGLKNFTINSFHVLLAALWKQTDATQVSTEEWNIGEKRYTAYIGNFGTRGSEGVTLEIPSDLFAKIEKLIKGAPLSEDIHWFRFFFCNVAEEHTIEALKDNEIWDTGLRCLDDVQWAKSSGYYSVRLFIILRAI